MAHRKIGSPRRRCNSGAQKQHQGTRLLFARLSSSNLQLRCQTNGRISNVKVRDARACVHKGDVCERQREREIGKVCGMLYISPVTQYVKLNEQTRLLSQCRISLFSSAPFICSYVYSLLHHSLVELPVPSLH